MKVETPKDDGGPAFPIETTATPYAPGMSLRDWFAGQVLQGSGTLLTSEAFVKVANDRGLPVEEAAAAIAYQIADAMMEARSK